VRKTDQMMAPAGRMLTFSIVAIFLHSEMHLGEEGGGSTLWTFHSRSQDHHHCTHHPYGFFPDQSKHKFLSRGA